MRVSNWPILYKDILRVKNPQHHLGICSLWTERDVVEKLLKSVDYCVIGNLYSAQGINAMIRNIMANPNIRTIVIWGSEMSLSGHALLQLKKGGLDKKRQIVGARGEIEKEIPSRIIDEFRREISVIDMRGKQAKTFVNELKELSLRKQVPFTKKTRIFPKSEPVARVFPSEQTGFRVSSSKVAKTWLKLLSTIYKYGRPKHTRYSQDNELKEILNLTAVVTNEHVGKVYFPDYLPFTKLELVSYYAELMTDREIPGVAYNYGKLLRKDFGLDQVAEIKNLLKKRPDSKKMATSLLDPKRYWEKAGTSDTPCLTQMFGSVQNKKFFLTAHFRSQDMVHGWPRNTFALRKLQKDIADSAGYKMGPLTIITHSAHIYGDDFKLVENLLADNYERELGFTPSVHFAFDPRGNVVVEVVKMKDAAVWKEYSKRYEKETVPYAVSMALKRMPKRGKKAGKLIRATLYDPDSSVPLKVFEGRVAQEVAYQIGDWNHIVDPAHAMYVGQELQRAEEAIITGKRYHQDPA